MASSTTALSLYERYTQLNHQLDEAREKRAVLQKCVEDIQDRLEQYETHGKIEIQEYTLTVNEETTSWQAEVDKAQEDVRELQQERDMLVVSRNALQQESHAKQAQRRMECRNFLAESGTFRQRQCPQVQLQVAMLPGDPSCYDDAGRLSRLWAVAMANGWETENLPSEGLVQETKRTSNFENLQPFRTEEISWNVCDAAFDEDEDDDEDIRQKLEKYREQRRLLDEAKECIEQTQGKLHKELTNQYQACSRRKEQLEMQFQRLSKEIQQLEVDISTTLAFRDLENKEFNSETQSGSANVTQPTSRVSLSPPHALEESIANPYKTRGNNSSTNSRYGHANNAKSARPPVASWETPKPLPQSYRPRNSISRKRKAAFGSSMEIGGAEKHVSAIERDRGSNSSYLTEMLSGLDDDDNEGDDDLLMCTPFSRKKP